MPDDEWREETRASYNTVAKSYAEFVTGALTGDPYLAATLNLFAALLPLGAPVADVGCGPGHVTAHLAELGPDAFGIDLSPAMIDLAREAYPQLTFEVGDMTELTLPPVAGILSFWSLIHIPDESIPPTLAGFHRALNPGGVLLLGFHAGDGTRLKTEGYGGHPMRVHVHRRQPARMTEWLTEAGFAVETTLLLDQHTKSPGAAIFARKP
nr:class I SAM-dependent methyltransferase [Dactylosporangium thailandense]